MASEPPAAQLAWGQRAIDELVKMHTSGTQHYDLACPAFKLSFDVPKLLSELQFFSSTRHRRIMATHAHSHGARRPRCRFRDTLRYAGIGTSLFLPS